MTPDQIAKHKGDQIASARDTRAKQGRGFGGTGTEDSVVPGAATSGPTSTREKVAEYLQDKARKKFEQENWEKTKGMGDGQFGTKDSYTEYMTQVVPEQDKQIYSITPESLTDEQISGAIQQKQQEDAAAKRMKMEEEAKKAAAKKAAEEKTAAEAAAAATDHSQGMFSAMSTANATPASAMIAQPQPGAGGDLSHHTGRVGIMNQGQLGVLKTPQAGAGGAMGAAAGAGGEGGVDIRTLVDAINSLNQVTVNVAVADINVILNTGGLADRLKGVIAAEALIALQDKITPHLESEVKRIVQGLDA